VTLIVCPNLAIDRVLLAARLEPGNLHRLRCLQHQAGGKGANVARVLKALGGRGLLVGVAAGSTGRLIGELAAAEGLDVLLVAADGEARVSNVIIEGDGRVTEVYEHGPGVDAATVTALLETVREQAGADDGWAIVNGHAPPGAGPDFYARLVHTLRTAGRRVMVDAAGPQLRHALAAGPDFVKVNALEACSAVGDPAAAGGAVGDPAAAGATPGEAAAALETDEAGTPDAPPALLPADHGDCDAVSATLDDAGRAARGRELCRRLVAAGAARAAVTIGGAGVVALADGFVYHARTEPVDVVSTVGSGDSFAARLLLGLERGEELKAALAGAAAAASANAASPLTAHVDPDEVARLAAGATVRVVPL
jgi:1-phosphofructokinase